MRAAGRGKAVHHSLKVDGVLIGAALALIAGVAAVQKGPWGRRDPAQLPAAKADKEAVAFGGAGRGRTASSPAEIPARGWWDVLVRIYGNISDHRILAIGAGVTFYSILALFPAVAAFVSLFGLFAQPSAVLDELQRWQGVLPAGGIEIISGQVERIASSSDGSLGVAFFISLVVALWSANAGMKALFDALNIVYVETEKRSFLMLNAVSLLFTACAILLLCAAMGIVVVLPILLNYVPEGGAEMLVRYGRWPVMFIIITVALAVLYRYGPSRERAQWRWLSIGSIFAASAWLLASMAFSWYAANFGSYNETYGSLGAIIGFMSWIWISSVVILIGAELNAEAEHQTVEDTTTGMERPLGMRGATMADTIGEAQD